MIPLILGAVLAVRLGPVDPGAPARSPYLAANSTTVAVAFGGGKTIYFSASHDRGKTFSTPVKVADASVLPLSRHRGPHVAFSGNAIVVTAVAGERLEEGPHAHGLPSDGNLLAWRSLDGGATWSKGKPVNDAPGSASEGLHALAAGADGMLVAVWLDKRGGKGTRLYASHSTDGGTTWSKNIAVYESPSGSICECCSPSAVFDAAGRILVMWRNSLDGARDLYLASSRTGEHFSTPQKLGTGTWVLNACPMDGGGLAAAPGKILTAWRRDGNVYLAEPDRPERHVGQGKDVALALSGDRTYVSWVVTSGVELWIDGSTVLLSPRGTSPALCSVPGGVLAAWEDDGGIQLWSTP